MGVMMGVARDHPRTRGEHTRVFRQGVPDHGSSPHSRGTLAHRKEYPCKLRIIPALAGNTDWMFRHPYTLEDHPRTRGEHAQKLRCRSYLGGSSPHSRGTPANNFLILESYRDHPRTRGEHNRMRCLLSKPWGSSPHSRGTLAYAMAIEAGDRIIPALAGNTFSVL